ncbi:hypothetical protein MTR67_019830 [Solanum verrucosum]|uniref:Uncharacterized protein n=1 Tax=Solanum verrucosum TaxID=315347 RepID=A0AAF0QSM5_SOLVR|nr:hypothetical protein MTR67_019830 [Solanum verrucosum]
MYHELGSALEGCVLMDEDYKTLLLFIEKGRFAYGGYRHNLSCTYTEDNVREKYKLWESSKGLKAKVRENRSISIVEKQKMKDGILSKKRGNKDRVLEIHGGENGMDNVRPKYELRSSKALKTNARKSRMEDGIFP